MRLNQQMKKLLDPNDEFSNVFWNDDWTTQDVKEFFRYVDLGYLYQDEHYRAGFIVNEYWQDDPLWEDDGSPDEDES